ncbi:MAG: hypothetical protein AAF411_27410, partial [Myxococcota bacterium]
LTTFEGSVGYRFVDPFEIYATVERDIAGDRTEVAVPGSDLWEFSITMRVSLGDPRIRSPRLMSAEEVTP